MNGPGIDNPLSLKVAGSTNWTYPLADHHGTATVTDSFGNPDGDFTGREYDSFTGLYYYRARMYDPNLGRFISEDPIGFGGGDINLYGYVWNNPLHFTDPTGEIPNPYDLFWWMYYSIRCGEDGIKCGNACNPPLQSQEFGIDNARSIGFWSRKFLWAKISKLLFCELFL